jgi:endoribonuclease LACTB2
VSAEPRPRPVARGEEHRHIELFPARTPTLAPATHTNSYALGERDVLLVEPATPYEDEQRDWLGWARGLTSQGRRPIAVALTHHHADHVGGAAHFARELGLPLWAHARTAALLPDLPIAHHIEDGETIVLDGATPQRWRVLHTPGHAVGHICLHEDALGVLVVGDMVASVGTILIAPHEGDMLDYLTQLDRLAALDAQIALPAHGAPITEGDPSMPVVSPTALFRFYIAHRLAREAKVLAALSAAGLGGADLDALLLLAYADTPPAIYPIARMSLESHLLKLARDGRARRGGAGWVSA